MFYIIDTRGYVHGEFQKYGTAVAFLSDLVGIHPELRTYEPEIIGPHAEDVADRIRLAGEWNMEDCAELCRLAGLDEEWTEADGDSFEDVIYDAADILGVEI